MLSIMYLQNSRILLQRNSQCGWRIAERFIKTGEPCRLPEKPYWKEREKKIPVKSFEEIPGPKPIFFLGNAWRYWPIIGQYSFLRLHETYETFFNEFGSIVREQVHPTRSIVHLYHPEDIMSVYNAPGKYPLRMSHRAMERYRRERPHHYSSAGLGASNGPEWLKFRKLFNNMVNEATLLSYPLVREKYFRAAEDVTDDLVVTLGKGLDSKNEIDVMTPFFRWALESIGMITLNKRLGCLDSVENEEADKLIKAAHTTNDAVYQTENRMSPLLQRREYKRLEEAQDFFSDVIRRHIFQEIADSHGEHSSMLALLLSVEFATFQDVCTLVLDFFQGGIHTVSYSLCFALLHLAKNKDKQDKLRKELIEFMPSKSSKMRESIVKMKYVDCVIKETLRMNPPTIGTGRILGKDTVLGGYNVPAGTMVILQHQVASMQEEFFRYPHTFNPERWAEESQYNLGVFHNVASYAYRPFGYGMRGCIGSAFARMELTYAISKIVRNFEVSYLHEPINTVNKLHNEPDKPVRLRFDRIED